MTVVETHIGGRRAAARDAAETRKKIVLAVLAVVLLALLAFQLPKIMTSSSSSSSTASTALVTPASPVVTGGGGEPVPAADAKRLRLIRQLEVKDPFVPLIHASTTASSSAPTAAKAASAARTRQSKRPVAKPVPFTPAAPTGAVIWTNGQRQVVGLHQVFNIGDAQFRLLAVTQKADAHRGGRWCFRRQEEGDRGAQGPSDRPRQHGDRSPVPAALCARNHGGSDRNAGGDPELDRVGQPQRGDRKLRRET